MGTAAGNYIDEDDVDNWAESATEAEKQAVIDLVEEIVESVTHDYFYDKAFDIRLDGNGHDRLLLGLIPDILSVSSVEISGVELSTDYYTHDKSFIFRDTEVVSEPELRWLLRQYAGNLFPRGDGNIHVIGTCGWPEKLEIDSVSGTFETKETITGGTSGATAEVVEVHTSYLLIGGRSSTDFTNDEEITGGDSDATADVNCTTGAVNNIPRQIIESCVMLAKNENDSTLYSKYIQGSEHLGDYSYTMRGRFYTGIREVDIRLARYVRKKPRLAMV